MMKHPASFRSRAARWIFVGALGFVGTSLYCFWRGVTREAAPVAIADQPSSAAHGDLSSKDRLPAGPGHGSARPAESVIPDPEFESISTSQERDETLEMIRRQAAGEFFLDLEIPSRRHAVSNAINIRIAAYQAKGDYAEAFAKFGVSPESAFGLLRKLATVHSAKLYASEYARQLLEAEAALKSQPWLRTSKLEQAKLELSQAENRVKEAQADYDGALRAALGNNHSGYLEFEAERPAHQSIKEIQAVALVRNAPINPTDSRILETALLQLLKPAREGDSPYQHYVTPALGDGLRARREAELVALKQLAHQVAQAAGSNGLSPSSLALIQDYYEKQVESQTASVADQPTMAELQSQLRQVSLNISRLTVSKQMGMLPDAQHRRQQILEKIYSAR